MWICVAIGEDLVEGLRDEHFLSPQKCEIWGGVGGLTILVKFNI